MIRALVIGTDAAVWSARLSAVVTATAEFEAVRLPAAAVRAFERSPPDVVVLCGDRRKGRLDDVLQALRERPVGRLAPCVAICREAPDGVDARVADDAEPEAIITVVAELLGIATQELLVGGPRRPSSTDTTLTESAITRKLRQVRHQSYFDVLDVSVDVSAADLRAAYKDLTQIFDPLRVPAELDQRFAGELAEIRDALEDALAVLGSHELRAAYSESRRVT